MSWWTTRRSTAAEGDKQPDAPVEQGGHKEGYRWDIQGMRAIAVVLVMLAHANVPGFAGGYIGVDVFFVISGFLITGLLLKDGEQHRRISFLRFYARRARRILPAATVVIVATSVASIAILNAYQAKSELIDGLRAAFFSLNVRLARGGTNYFNASTTVTSPLQHFWSLSVEEQFYVVWPALLAISGFGLVALTRRARGGHADRGSLSTARVTAVLVVLGAASLYFSIRQTGSGPHAAYFSTIDRAWELIAGALLAVRLLGVARLPGPLRASLTWLGLAGIGVASTTFNSMSAVPGWITLLPVLSAAAVIAGGVGPPRWAAAWLLSRRPFRFFGAISYSLYLWHWPILILAAGYFSFPLNLGQRLGLLGLATVMATLSYRLIELPFQRARWLTRRNITGMVLWPVAVGMIVIVTIVGESEFSFAGAKGPADPSLSAPAAVIAAVVAAQDGAAIPRATSPSVLKATTDLTYIGACSAWKRYRSKICEFGDPTGSRTIVVFGNSHSVMWIPSVSIISRKAKWKFFPVVKEACGYDDYANLLAVDDPKNQCVDWYHWALTVIARLHPDVIVVGAYGFREWAKGLSDILPKLKKLAPRVVLIADTPGIEEVPGFCLSQSGATQATCLWPESHLRIADLDIARRLARTVRIGFINPESWLCYRHLCPSVINGIIPYYDSGHLTATYARYLAPELGDKLALAGWSP